MQGNTAGSPSVYGHHANASGEESEHVGLPVAVHATLVFAAVRTQRGLTRSAATRQVIGQAQGILMERRRLTTDQAFAARPARAGRAGMLHLNAPATGRWAGVPRSGGRVPRLCLPACA